ncbi:hypothetical protein BPTFM16_02926 [Altererythrobacter insulae]|nr:hypothetical protein BPTFM16_02926 [Altererythrobacter insulae]
MFLPKKYIMPYMIHKFIYARVAIDVAYIAS